MSAVLCLIEPLQENLRFQDGRSAVPGPEGLLASPVTGSLVEHDS
jgi:hypothetical protein